jgi:hypothetical protein
MPSSGMWLLVGITGTDASEEYQLPQYLYVVTSQNTAFFNRPIDQYKRGKYVCNKISLRIKPCSDTNFKTKYSFYERK